MDYQSFALKISFFTIFAIFFASFFSKITILFQMYSLSTFWHWSIWLLLFHIAVITPSPDSRYVLNSSPDRSEWSVNPCFNPQTIPYWVNIVPSSNEIFTLRVTPGSDLIDHMDRGQPGVKWPSREGFGSSNRKWAQIFQGHFLELKISFSLTINYINS